MGREAFLGDVEKQDSVLRRIEIIGEAAKRIPTSVQQRYPDLPWREIAGTRDIIAHEYFRVDVDLVWDMVKADVPALVGTRRAYLGRTRHVIGTCEPLLLT